MGLSVQPCPILRATAHLTYLVTASFFKEPLKALEYKVSTMASCKAQRDRSRIRTQKSRQNWAFCTGNPLKFNTLKKTSDHYLETEIQSTDEDLRNRPRWRGGVAAWWRPLSMLEDIRSRVRRRGVGRAAQHLPCKPRSNTSIGGLNEYAEELSRGEFLGITFGRLLATPSAIEADV